MFSASGYSGIDASAARNRPMAASRSPPCASSAPRSLLASARSGLQDERALERGAGPGRLPASGEQSAETIQRRGARVRLGRALERDHGGTLESVIEKLPAVRQVVAERQSGIERSLKGHGASEALGRRHVDRARVLHDLADVHAIAVDLHDVAAPIEEQTRGQTQILPIHEQMPVEDGVAQAHFRSGHDHRRAPEEGYAAMPDPEDHDGDGDRSHAGPGQRLCAAPERLERRACRAHVERPQQDDCRLSSQRRERTRPRRRVRQRKVRRRKRLVHPGGTWR